MNSFLVAVACFALFSGAHCLDYIFNFNTNPDLVDSWTERSDVQARAGAGESKGVITSLESNSAFRAEFFALANSLNYSPGVGSVRVIGSWDLSSYSKLVINARGMSTGGFFSFVLKNSDDGLNTVYKNDFVITTEFQTIEVSLDTFYVVREEGAIPLDLANIYSIGISLTTNVPGEYLGGNMEINWIGAE